MSFDGRVALVTGGSRGIGHAAAALLARGGARVAVCARTQADAEAAAQALRDEGQEAMGLSADVADAAQAEAAVRACTERFGRLDILVNNAGIRHDGLVLRMRDAEWDRVLAVNLTGAFHCIRAALRGMVRQRAGRIINVTSVVAARGNAGQANYVSAKAGLIGLTKAVALEVASRGISVNAVAPGFIETAMTADLGDEARRTYMAQIPAGRFGRPEEVAWAIGFLASEAAGYITGQVLHVNGGMWM
ncbi:MAG TPA: 3-oxoacyl-[acyl-carrier-protein] reductase [Candidatus Sulfotelmatobacter sp.]|nr:3-oxoacyl-[acyl-carrier-protein] reductase [Candidatus Sulfotelmatobacter sp.]